MVHGTMLSLLSLPNTTPSISVVVWWSRSGCGLELCKTSLVTLVQHSPHGVLPRPSAIFSSGNFI